MTGVKRGVATNIAAKEERAVFTHCYGHALNLAVGECVRNCKLLRNTLDSVHEISKLIKYSPKRDSAFEMLKSEMNPDTPGFRVLCPTRWTVRAGSLGSVLNNYSVLQSLWELCYEQFKDSEIRSRILGVQTQMATFDFFFGVSLGHLVLRHTDNLSRTLQHKDMSASEGQSNASLTIETLTSLRSDNEYDMFWEKVNAQFDSVDVNESVLPRQGKVPRRFEVCSTSSHEYPETAKDRYRHIYFEALDLMITFIKDRFDQPGYRIYRNLQDLLLECAAGNDYSEHFQNVVNFYKGDLKSDYLSSQLDTFKTLVKEQPVQTFNDIVRVFKEMKPASIIMFSEIVKIVKLILVMPATNATSERTFSALRRLKTYLRTTMTQERLTHLMTLYVHRTAVDAISLTDVANEFEAVSESRKAIFGQF